MMLRLPLLALLCGLALPALAQPAVGPQPPCGSLPVYPPYGAVDGKPLVATWRNVDLHKLGWQVPSCMGWGGDSRLVAALAARFHSTRSLDELAAPLAAVSDYPAIKFWAITRREWRPMALAAWSVEGPDGKLRQPDPPVTALQPGRDFYYAEDAEMAGRAVYRLRVLEHSADRLVLETENVTPIRVAIVTLFEPAALQVATFLQRLDGDVWGLYEITRASADSSSMVAGYQSSYLNRLEAIRRLLAGQPLDRDPPIAPW
ncbi:hypothetical protein SAMN02745126_05946 [Enhydrobacter aerosaccus]|uniref:Uncharacterized protein n=1 Tax=Enhydrobacter aerosaccus TaxID=225324 RepID=A0A1T4TBE9_9HYPH|nr:DUF6675 family protein [Enhydrobacter aerosaccus]SKA37727.1 hypothetical protein SAMN02745126_05946 [Enhydrobacter aerosaccus]